MFRVKIETTAGNFVVEVHRDWAPLRRGPILRTGARQISSTTRASYRTVAGHWVQFGIAGDPKVAQHWRHRTFPDDPVPHQHNDRAYVAFAMTGPGQRTTQVYINLVDNRRLEHEGFAPFGKVVEGMDVVDRLYSGYGETSGGGMRAGKQDKLFEEGNAYLDREYPQARPFDSRPRSEASIGYAEAFLRSRLDNPIQRLRCRRAINKDGSFNVDRHGGTWRNVHPYLHLINASWPAFLGIVCLAYLVVNTTVRGGLFRARVPRQVMGTDSPTSMARFINDFFFSAHTITTVGYGNLAPAGVAANSCSL